MKVYEQMNNRVAELEREIAEAQSNGDATKAAQFTTGVKRLL